MPIIRITDGPLAGHKRQSIESIGKSMPGGDAIAVMSIVEAAHHSLKGYQNITPVANAGTDVTVSSQTVQLNGAGSFDSDGAIVSYAWTWAGGSATGVNPTVFLPYGVTDITLVATDNNGGTQTDHVIVKVFQPPVANAGIDISSASTSVQLNGSGSTPTGSVITGYALSLIHI